jgi:hypothetical protein
MNENVNVRVKYIQMALTLNFNPNIPHDMISLRIQRTYFKCLNNTWIVEFSILKEEIQDQKPHLLNSEYKKRTYEAKKKKLSFCC